MGIVRELSPELDPVEFPDTMSPEQVEAYVAEKGDELRRRLIARKQASMAAETEGEEALKYAMGDVPLSERVGSTILNLPQTAMRQMGGTLRGLGAYLAEAPIPRERGEVGTGVVQENLRRRQRTPEQVAAEIEQSAIREAGTGMQEAAPEVFPTLPGVRESLPSQVAGGLGSIAALAPAMVTGPAAPFVGGAMYGLSAGEDFVDDARRVIRDRIAEALANGDYDTAANLERQQFDMEDKARQAGRIIGFGTEAALGAVARMRVGKSSIGGIGERLAERLVAKSAPQAVQRAVRGAVEGGATEAAQEATEQALGNAAALAVYDPDRSIMDDLGQAALVGGLTGGIAGGARGSDRRNPLPRSTAAAAGKRVAQEIPQDVGDIAAPDITEADVEDVFAGVPVEETVAVEEVVPATEPQPAPVETPAAAAPAEQPTAAAPVETPPQLTPEVSAVANFTTSKGSEYSLDSNGNTTRLKKSAGKGQGQIHEAMPVVFISPQGSDAILNEMNVRTIIAEQNPDGSFTQLRPAFGEKITDSGNLHVLAVSRVDGQIQATIKATTKPAVGLHPFEIAYRGDQRTTHLGNQITTLNFASKKPKPNAIEAAITATPAPEPTTPPQAEAPRVTIPPNDAASATRASEADIPLGVKRPAVADPKLESLSDAEFTKARRAADANLESLEKRYDAEDPTLSRSELAAAQDAFTALELERFRRSKKGLYAPDLFYDLVKLADRARDPNSEAAAQARILIEEIQRQGMSLDQLVSELSASSPDEAEVLRGQAEDLKSVLGQQKPTGIESRAIDVESRQVAGQPAPVAGAPEEGIADPVNRIPTLPTNLAEAIAAEEAPDVFVENTVRKFGEGERASAQSTKPTERQRQVLEQGKRVAAEKGWNWNNVKETARRQLGLNENFLKPESRADQMFQMMRKEDADAAKRGQRTADEMSRIDAETKARKDKEAADKAEKEATQRKQAEEKAAASERQTAQEHDQIVAKLPKKWMASWKKAKTKKAKAKLLNEAMVASGTRNETALTAALDRAQEPTAKQESDRLERALDAAIKATDPKSATFSDPFLIAAVGLPVLNAALRLARRVYLRTRNLVRAKQQGMRLIRRRQRTILAADMPRVEEAFSNLVDNGITEGPPPQTVTAASPLPGGPRRASRGLFKGDVTIDSDAQWQAQADEWIAQFNGNLRRAFETARSTDFQTTGLNQSAQYYVFGKLLELSEIAANAAPNGIDAFRHINLQAEITEALKFDAAEAGKTLAAANLVQNRLQWMFPVLTYRNLIREEQKRLPFPDVVADEVRTWLSESGRRAVQEMRNAMTDADKVFARELKSTVRDMRVVWRDVMTASAESQENMRRKILEELVKAPELKGLSRQGYIDIANLLGKAWEKERARIFQAEFRKQVPLPSVKEDDRRKLFTAIPNILKWANLGLLDNEAFRNAIAPQYGVAKFDGETAKKLNTMAQEAQKVGGSNRNRLIMDMYNVMQQEGGVRAADVFRDYWYAAVLSGVRTQVDNAMNILTGALTSAMGITMAKSEARGTIAKAYGKGFAEAVHDFWPILWHGEVWRNVNFNPNQPSSTLEAISKSGNVFSKALGLWKYVGRLQNAVDHINALSTEQAMMAWALSRRLPLEHLHRYMTPSETVLKQARARAEAEGTKPQDMNKRVREIVQESIPVEILISARDLRQLVTFTNQPKGVMGGLYRGIQEMEKARPGFKMLSGTQFIRFAGNYTNEILNYAAPVALYRYYKSAPARQAESGLRMGEEERQLILAKMALGSALGVFAAALFLGDDDEEKDRKIDITGSFKSLDSNKKNQLLDEGRQPYSIRFGNTYVSYRQLPFGGVLGAIGELRDRQLFNRKEWDQESLARKVADAGMAGAFIVRDSSAISGLTEFLGMANSHKYDMDDVAERSMPKYLAKIAGSVVPNITKEIDAWADPSIFRANTGFEYFLQQVPYLRREVGAGPFLNVLGEPARVERYPYSRWVRTRQEDKAWSTLGTLASRGVFLSVPSANVKVLENGKRRPMTPQEQHAYQKRVGAGYRKFVEDNSEKLLRMKPDEAAKFIKDETERIRRRND